MVRGCDGRRGKVPRIWGREWHAFCIVCDFALYDAWLPGHRGNVAHSEKENRWLRLKAYTEALEHRGALEIRTWGRWGPSPRGCGGDTAGPQLRVCVRRIAMRRGQPRVVIGYWWRVIVFVAQYRRSARKRLRVIQAV